MMRATKWALAAGLLVSAGALVSWNPFGWTAVDRIVDRARDAAGIVRADVNAGHTDLYTCSMHPQVLQHEPGTVRSAGWISSRSRPMRPPRLRVPASA